MNDEIIDKAIPLLVEASRSADPVAAFLDLASTEGGVAGGDFMRSAPGPWSRAAVVLGEDLVGVIRLLTLLEREDPRRFGAGSVSPVIWLFRRFVEGATRAAQEDLANWILAQTSNEYLPFGSSNFGAKSLDELMAFRQRLAARKATVAQDEANRAAEGRRRRAERATRNIFDAIRRHDLPAVESLLRQGADLAAIDPEGRTPEAFAKELGHEDIVSCIRRGPSDSGGTV